MSDAVNLLKKIIELKPGGEVREQQQVAVKEIDESILTDTNLLLEAPTGSGKTLSYLIPIASNQTRAVVTSATKQLSEQIMDDIAFLNKSLRQVAPELKVNAALLKGRDNYLCLSKFDDMQKLDSKAATLFDMGGETNEISAQAQKIASEAGKISKWGDETKNGDRSEAPAVSDETWRQYSSTNVECPGKAACPFGDVCFAELARDKAKEANVVVTNHAIAALDLAAEGQLLGDRDAFVFDELHELDNYLSSAWGAELTYRRLEAAHKTIKSIPSIPEQYVTELKALMDGYDAALKSVPLGLMDNEDTSIKLENFIMKLYNVATKIATETAKMEKEANSDALKRLYTGAKKTIAELAEIANVLSDSSIENIRWTADSEANTYRRKNAKKAPVVKKDKESTLSMHAAPLRVGPKLQRYLTEREAIMIGLSATITVMGGFDIPLHNFGLEGKKNKTLALDSPFDYKKQAILYIPDPSSFPLPIGEDRMEHAQAVKDDSVDFIKAAGGRALILSTTAYGVKELTDNYREKLPKLNFLAQGDAPNAQLVRQFKEETHTSLIGTMGFWHGLDAPGDTLSLVIIDKLPFPSPNDPKMLARKNYADKMGRNGFMEVYVTMADWMGRQGFGRAIRSRSDKAVIIFYDVRLITKNYGRAILNNLHGVGLYHDKEKVLSALTRLNEQAKKTGK